jgi:DNA-binding Lrp family transcriptional regulator
MNLSTTPVPTQSMTIYKQFANGEPYSAKDIANKLGILPNTVYRAVRPLIKLGLIEKINTYPSTYKAVPDDLAMSWYIRNAAADFRQMFGPSLPNTPNDSLPRISIIKDRRALLTICEREARNAKKTMNYIVSGHSIPDGTILAEHWHSFIHF